MATTKMGEVTLRSALRDEAKERLAAETARLKEDLRVREQELAEAAKALGARARRK